MEQRNAQEIQPRSIKFGLQYRYWERNMDLWIRMSPKVNNNPLLGVFQNESKPTKVVCSRSAVKQMVACFFSYTGMWQS